MVSKDGGNLNTLLPHEPVKAKLQSSCLISHTSVSLQIGAKTSIESSVMWFVILVSPFSHLILMKSRRRRH